ncbi:PCMD domain-containing protein [Dysgonomonas sp. 520]|uniref:PCMD domain-containing protein n=1 Tax=Dysgonomonas sp. 520 TaxID=2302931 RepID=UPI0013D031BA|nr:PCMD domain-containing protein [Dysgonomonas sp. 520]NDW10738.1 glycoside hydrolase xylanase [Dysgonomonas sp. 520]
MKSKNQKKLIATVFCSLALSLNAQQERIAPVSFGDMDKWMVREVKESSIIGGNTKYLYEIVSGDTLFNNTAFKNRKSPWATSSVLAKVKGVTKGSVTVFPEKRDNGYCARLETRMEECKVLGLISIDVIASGTIFLGEMIEPITSTSNPQSKLVTGIPYTGRPIALMYDYKVVTGGLCTKATGFGKKHQLNEPDMAEVQLLLQHRWEDEAGNVFAKRVATGWERYGRTNNTWQNGHRVTIQYGDITSKSFYKPYMGLKRGDIAYYTRNSKGKMVPIQETEWAKPDEAVTHIVLQFSSSNGGAYTGNINSRLWIDNVKLVHKVE